MVLVISIFIAGLRGSSLRFPGDPRQDIYFLNECSFFTFFAPLITCLDHIPIELLLFGPMRYLPNALLPLSGSPPRRPPREAWRRGNEIQDL